MVSIATANNTAMSICRRFITETKLTSTSGMSTCIYNSSSKMVTFSLTASVSFNNDYTYEIGNIINPSSTVTVTGFVIRIENSSGAVLYTLSSPTANVYISPGDITS